jgi:hypothetical protein
MNTPSFIPFSKTAQRFLFSLAALSAAALSPHATAASNRGVYCGNEFYAPTAQWQINAQQSDFTSLFLFTMHVNTNGDLQYNDTMVVQNGVYIGDSTWKAKLAACKGNTCNRIEMCIGSYGSSAFANIKSLIASQGTGTGSILYKNFLALENATGVDGFQFDDENEYDATSMVAFAKMLTTMGSTVSLVPYTNQSFWVNVRSQLGSKVSHIYLQCYDGGAGNDPAQWTSAFGGVKVEPGLWGNTDTTSSATTKFRNWQQQIGITGGFMWLNGSLPGDAPKWGKCVRDGIDNYLYFEAESLAINASSTTVDTVTDSSNSNGAADILRATTVGDYVTYLVPNIASGTYTVSVGMKKNNTRGQFQLSGSRADQSTWTNIGSTVDEYSSDSGDYVEINVGTWAPGTTNDKLFKFSVVGENSSSTQYWIDIDYIRLTK